jgi:hypothetical protein
MKAAMWTTIAVSLAVPLGGLGWLLYVDYSLRAGFHKVEVGQSQDQVESVLGKPSGLEECGHFGGTVGREIPSSCVKEHSYLSLLPLPDVWTVGFDDTKRVVWKYRYISP